MCAVYLFVVYFLRSILLKVSKHYIIYRKGMPIIIGIADPEVMAVYHLYLFRL